MKRLYIRPGQPMPTADELEACDEVVLVSEPFWVQDIRMANAAIEAQRLALRRATESGKASDELQ